MRTNLLNGLSNVVKKGASLAGCAWRQNGRMSEEGAIEHPFSTHSAPFGTRWKQAGNKYSISMRSFTRLAAMVTLLLTLACGNVWALNSTLTKGETIFIYKEKNNDAWRDNACVKAWFNKDGSGGSAVVTYWLCNSTSDSDYKCYWAIVPSDDLNRVTLQRFGSNCSSYYNDEGYSNQSDRSSDDYNVIYSTNYTSGWKNQTFSFYLKTDVDSWGSNVATFEDKGDGLFQCTYTFTATATNHNFVVYDSWGHRYGRLADNSNFYLGGLKSGSVYTVVASFKIQDCDANNQKTSLSVMTIHEPGMYVSASGYNKTLATRASDNLKYETYGISKVKYNNTSSTIVLTAAEQVSNSTEYKDKSNLVYVFSSVENFLSAKQWFGSTKYNSTGSAAGIKTDEFTAHMGSSAQEIKNQAGQEIILCIKGYNQFSMIAKDNDGSSKYFKVEVDGVDVTTNKKNSATIRRYDISADTHIIRVLGVGNSNSEFWGFSLRPSAPTITASSLSGATYDQGAAAAALSVTVSPVVAGHTPTYQWYSNTTNKNTGGTIIGEATSASYTPPTTSTGTKYYYCVVSEEGCNSKTSDVSGAITVNAVVVPCSATQPGTISKGAASGGTGTITLTADGTPASNNTWYWQASAEGTSTSESGATKNVSAAGTYYIRSYCSDGSGCWSDARSVTVTAADLLTPITPSLTYASTVTYGSTISPTLTGNAGSGTVTYSLNSVSPAGSLTIISSTGVVTGATAGGTATVTATIAANGNYAGGSATSGTITVAKAALPGTASTGTATSVTHNSATLPYTISDVTGVASVTIKVYEGGTLRKTYDGQSAVASGSCSATGLSASTTYTYTVTLIGDANHNNSAETAKSTSFTTDAAPTLTALVDGTLYKANGIFYGDIPTSDTYVGGISDNGKFFFEGSASASPHNTMKWKNYTVTLNEIEFAAIIYFDGASTLSSNNPTTRAMKFILPSAGTLTIYYRDNNDGAGKVKLNKSGSEPTWSSTTKGNNYATTSELSAGTYYLYATGGSTGIFGVQFDATAATYTVSASVNPAEYGTLSASSITDVASGTAISASSNVLTVEGKTPITATPADASAQYTYAFSNWTKSDGTALPSTVTADLCVYANFTRTANNYTLTWNTNGGSDLECDGCTSGSTAYGASITAPTDPTLSNYTFDGWKTNNDGTGSAAAATMSAANTTYYAAWKQTVTLTTGSQGSGSNQTPHVYKNGTAVSSFTAHTASGYTLQGYYTASTGGTKVLNADGTFAAANVTDYITSSKWSRTGAAPTLYAQWRAAAGKTCYTWDAAETHPQTGTVSYDGLYLTASTKAKKQANSALTDTIYDVSSNTKSLTGHINGAVIDSLIFGASTSDSRYTTFVVSFCSTQTFDTANIIKVGGYQCTVYNVALNTAAASLTKIKAPAGTKSFVLSRNYLSDKLTSSASLSNNGSRYLYYVRACSASGGTHTISYANGGGTGTMSSNTGITDDGSQALTSNSFTAPTNFAFAGWVADVDVTIGGSTVKAGALIANGATITNIISDIALTAKWSQSLTLDDNDENHGATGNGSATAYYNATALSSITHTTATSGYKLAGYYTAKTDGTKVLNSDGTFAGTSITGYISDGKWIQNTTSTPTLYAQYESAGALTWNLVVNSDTTALSTSSKTSAFTEISNANMTDAALTGLTYTKSKKSSLTGKISTPASEDASKYVSVSFQVAAGYKFTPSSIKVKVQPISADQYVKLELKDNAGTPNSITYTTASKQAKGSISTVEMTNGSSVEFTGTVTLKIFCYGMAYDTDGYRLGTPITIEGEVAVECETMPSYSSMSYSKTDYIVGDTPSAISITGATNVNTYLWKSNTTNDRSGGSAASGTNNTSSYTPSTASAGTTYYWCEMTNTSCGITIKTPAVAINVNSSKSNATIAWTDPASTPNYGGGNYTIKATVNETGWDGNASDLNITAPAGIRIYGKTSGTTDSKQWVQVKFDVQTSFDRETYSKIPFTVSADATSGYNAISAVDSVIYSACTGGGEAEETYLPVDATHIDDETTVKGGWLYSGTGWIRLGHGSSSLDSKNVKSLAHNMGTGNVITEYYKSSKNYFGFHNESAINGVRLYVYTTNTKVTVSNVYIGNSAFNTGTPSSGAVSYETSYYNDDDGLLAATNDGCTWVEILFDDEVAAGKYGQINLSGNVYIAGMAFLTTSGSGASLTTTLTFATAGPIAKAQGDASFTNAASLTSSNANSLGAITYSSSNTSCATVNATTGEVTITATGESASSTTITATLAASGCYKSATKTYTLNVSGSSCTDVAGTVTADELTCGIRLTLSGYTEGATIKWYQDGDEIVGATGATYDATEAGSYYAVTHNVCNKASNTVVLADRTVSAERVVEKWYIKNGRVTPDIALWNVGEGTSLSSVAWSPANATGLTAEDFYQQDSVIYLKGKSPSSNDSGADIEYTLTLTVSNGCNTTAMSDASKKVKLIHQKNTDKHVLAFVVTGTEKGGFTEGITAAQTTSVKLYNTIAANFDVLATNIYSTDDEKKLKEYYSQFDILCVTDYPNTKTQGSNSKSYVDALGSLVDIRPILTMEAWVSGLANWKGKGVSGTPKSPTTRQYAMDLQCKDHEIFSGTDLVKIGEGDETMYRVTMVEKDSDDYKTLDATYGEGTHEEKKNYNYGGKPALQGFTFNATMVADGLLPLGLIDDGAGNDLQVGIERQTEMSARLMVLGINSYAMERLTEDGQTVVINALKYLLKKNEEEIADCSIAFYGGTEGHETDWNTDANWKGGMKPDKTAREIRILAPVVITTGQKVHAQAPIKIASGGKYNDGADEATGKITIEAGGALIVDGEIKAVTAPAYSKARATEVTDLILNTSGSAQSALILNNDDGDTKATVNLYSLGRYKDDAYQFQYFAVPMTYLDINPAFAGQGIYTYVWTEASGWERRGYYKGLEAFEGVGITTTFTEAKTYQMKGTLASTEEREITLTTGGAGAGQNIIGNSWLAPIDIASLKSALLEEDVDEVVYIYCTGNDGDAVSSGGSETPGQWLAIPIDASGWEGWSGLKVIPAMQGFCIIANSETTLTLNYNDHVRSTASDKLTPYLRAPKREASHEGIDLIRIRVADSQTHTDLYLFEGESFSEEFDNGWEAKYMSGDGRSAKLYAETAIGPMAVVAQPEYEGTILGFAPGKETEYTFTFSGPNKEYYLNDLKEKKSTLISEDESYMFTFEEGDTNRFYISKTPINAPSVATGTENTGDGTKARKVLVNDKLYIILNGRVYSAEGVMVK